MDKCKHGIPSAFCGAYGCKGYRPPVVTTAPRSNQKSRVLDAIVASGPYGADHESLRIRLNIPEASVRRVTQQLRSAGLIRLDTFDDNRAVFVAVPGGTA